jgi:hypothetical protein
MPRFSKEERALLIEVADTFARTTEDRKVRGHLNNAVRKLRHSDEALTRREAEKRRGIHVLQQA